MNAVEKNEVREFLKSKGHVGLLDSELPIFLRHFLKGELGRNYKACWERDTLGAFYEDIFTPAEFKAIENALIWLEELEANS